MIYIVTAMYCEARSLIRQFHLKKDVAHTKFQVFWNEENGVCLIISGTGEIAAAAAVSSICTEYHAGSGDFLVNIGVCAGTAYGMFLCSKITEESTGKTFYPDIVYRHGFGESEIVTGMRPLDTGAYRNSEDCVQSLASGQSGGRRLSDGREADRWHRTDILYDMESAAVYQAGSYFFGPHQMSFLKIVSDQGNGEEVSPEQVERLFEEKTEEIASYLRRLQQVALEQKKADSVFGEAFAAFAEKLCNDMHCSQVMRVSLLQYIRYLALSGADYTAVAEEMYREQKLPCRDKREGKIRFEEFKRRIL